MKNDKKRLALKLLYALLFNVCVYYGGRLLSQGRQHISITTEADRLIPVLSWTVVIYFGAFIFWGICYYICVTHDRSGYDRFLISHYIGESVCFLFFVFMPATLEWPEITGTGLFDRLLGLLYSIDSPDCLLPSIHCFVSWLCWIGVRGNPEVPKRHRYVILEVAAAICISTLTTKQHVIADVVTGITLAELSYIAAGYCGRFIKRNRKESE